MTEQQRQQVELAQRHDEHRGPPDPMTTDVAEVLLEMGFSAERTREAILTVRQQRGSPVETAQQVLTWLLDDEERRLNADIDAKSLKAENEKLREMHTCKICMEQPVNTTLLPCGHFVCCGSCAPRLKRCPICRKKINGTVKTFMS